MGWYPVPCQINEEKVLRFGQPWNGKRREEEGAKKILCRPGYPKNIVLEHINRRVLVHY